MRTLGPRALLLNRIEFAHHLLCKVFGTTRQNVPHVHERVRARVDHRPANCQCHILQEAVPDCIVPAGRRVATHHLAILDAHNRRNGDLRVRMPRQVTLAGELVLCRPAETCLRRSSVKVDRLQRQRQVFLVHETPEADARLLNVFTNQQLVRVAAGGKLRKDSVVSRTHGLLHALGGTRRTDSERAER